MSSILTPWVTLREVSVEVELPSPKVAILRFERGMQQGLLGRISRTSIMEYHAFGIISEGRKSRHHYMVCGVQGDFTKALVMNPPKTVWTRELKFGWSLLLVVFHCILIDHSRRRTRLSNVQERYPDLYRDRYRSRVINLYSEPRLVPYLDRIRSGEDFRLDYHWSHSQTH